MAPEFVHRPNECLIRLRSGAAAGRGSIPAASTGSVEPNRIPETLSVEATMPLGAPAPISPSGVLAPSST